MSGNPSRLISTQSTEPNIQVKGFNNTSSLVAASGYNQDNIPELYVPAMPKDLVLLCAADYSTTGATILLPTEGYVLSLSPTQQQFLRDYAKGQPITKTLTLKNNTYEVGPPSSVPHDPTTFPSAHSASATKYFNSKVNVSNTQERILATLLTGLTFRDLLFMSNNNSVAGLPRDITTTTLHTFENKYGRTPDVLQLAFPDLSGNTKGYFAPKQPITHIGQRIEADFFEAEFNELPDPTTPPAMPTSKPRSQLRKLSTFGGATAAYVYIDVYTGYVNGLLVTSMANPLPLVKATVEAFKSNQFKVDVFSADQGILTQSLFRVAVPAVQAYLKNQNIIPECGEAYNHNNGTPYIEHTIRQIKELQRFAMLYILRNPNFHTFGFTRTQILKLWGELFYWALTIINLKPSFCSSSITKHEAYFNTKPDLRAIRLLPIFSALYVYRHASHSELQSQHDYWQFGLYVGPSPSVPGAIRAAVLTNKRQVHIITTTAIKSVSDGGQVSIYPTSVQGLDCLQDVVIPPTTTPSIEDPLVIFDHSAPPILQSRHSNTTGLSSLPPPMDDPLTLTHDTPSASVLPAPTVDPVAPSSAPADDPVIAPSSDPPDDPVVRAFLSSSY